MLTLSRAGQKRASRRHMVRQPRVRAMGQLLFANACCWGRRQASLRAARLAKHDHRFVSSIIFRYVARYTASPNGPKERAPSHLNEESEICFNLLTFGTPRHSCWLTNDFLLLALYLRAWTTLTLAQSVRSDQPNLTLFVSASHSFSFLLVGTASGVKPPRPGGLHSSVLKPSGFRFPSDIAGASAFCNTTNNVVRTLAKNCLAGLGSGPHSLSGARQKGEKRRIANVQERSQFNWFRRKRR
jgi:hypothetical protein